MCPYVYYDIMRKSKDPRHYRLQMALCAKERGIKPTAALFQTTTKTVRKWTRRWQEQGWEGLCDQSRAPKQPCRRITQGQRTHAIELKKELPSWGAARIKRDYELELSEKALRRIWKQEGLLKRKRKKHRTKQDLRAVKATWRLFEQVELDTKTWRTSPSCGLRSAASGSLKSSILSGK